MSDTTLPLTPEERESLVNACHTEGLSAAEGEFLILCLQYGKVSVYEAVWGPNNEAKRWRVNVPVRATDDPRRWLPEWAEQYCRRPSLRFANTPWAKQSGKERAHTLYLAGAYDDEEMTTDTATDLPTEQHEIQYRCGHCRTVTLYGDAQTISTLIARHQSSRCEDCVQNDRHVT